jgi:hypothetical protein
MKTTVSEFLRIQIQVQVSSYLPLTSLLVRCTNASKLSEFRFGGRMLDNWSGGTLKKAAIPTQFLIWEIFSK